MAILDIIRKPSGDAIVHVLQIDDLVREASTIGGLRIWQYARDHDYQVGIVFRRATGTEIEAKSRNSDLLLALRAAIAEARTLGAA